MTQLTMPEYPRLPRSWKNRYPFRIACPSFVYPADYDVNVDLLAPHVDEIELLLFESRPASRPDQALIRRMADLGRQHAVGYHVHLPTDLTLFDDDPAKRHAAIGTLENISALIAPLQPSFGILHLEMSVESGPVVTDRRKWEQRVMRGLEGLRAAGDAMPPLRIENQTVPLDWFEPVLAAYDLALCLDIGHLKLAGAKLDQTLSRFHPCIGALHIHGTADGKDHQPLTCLSAVEQDILASYLRSFRGSVSVEVFNFKGLSESLRLVEEWLD